MDNRLLDCKLCGNSFDTYEVFSKHLFKQHKISAKNYFEKIFTKLDLFSDSPLEFKSYEQYYLCDFSCKKNYKAWASSAGASKLTKYYTNKLKQYAGLKNITKAPGYTESVLAKCLLPTDFVEKNCQLSFNKISELSGLNCEFQYENSLPNLPNGITDIIIDTREQKPFKFPDLNVLNAKLEFGDYAKNDNKLIVVERKSLSDLRSTLSTGFNRFCREITRAQENDGYIVVVVESTLEKVLYEKNRFGKCSSEFLAHKMRSILRTYSNIQFVFTENRLKAQDLTLRVLNWGDRVRSVDIQYFLQKWPL
jgi:hypothetical protein